MGVTEKVVVLRRSARDPIMWHLHVVLDSVPEGPTGREEFARRMLREFGVSEGRLEETVERACAALPPDLAKADAIEMLRAFEAAIPIEWHNDMVAVDATRVGELRSALLRMLASRTPDILPKAMTERVVGETRGVLGAAVETSLVAPLRETIENLLVYELWRTREQAEREQLVERLMYTIRTGLRLDFQDR